MNVLLRVIAIATLTLLIIANTVNFHTTVNENFTWVWADWTGIGEDKVIKKTTEKIGGENGSIQKVALTEETHSGKTLWDLLQLFAVPFLLLYLGNQIQRKDKEIAATNLREEALQKFLDRVSDLLIVPSVYEESVKKDLLQTRTLTVLRSLDKDGERKGSVIKFLIEVKLIGSSSLDKLDLSNADLTYAKLSNTLLEYVKLGNANLSHADLTGSDLSDADLRNANLSNATLVNARLVSSDLYNAKLENADMTNAELTSAKLNEADFKGTKLDRVTGLEKSQCSQVKNFPKKYQSRLLGGTTT
jgi:uncharacterized protein YjbI with pentapeptide repeats